MLLVESKPVQERPVDWVADASGYYAFGYKRDGEWYGWLCKPEFRRECLKAVTIHAGNPELSLDYDDAAEITAHVRLVVPVDSFTPAVVEPAVVDLAEGKEAASRSARMLGLVMLYTVATWLVASVLCFFFLRGWR